MPGAIAGSRAIATGRLAGGQGMMELPTREGIFSQLAVEQDTNAIAREIADLILDRG
jgi:hypothetical protein